MKVIYNGQVIEERGQRLTTSLPTDVDDVVVYASVDAFPATGEVGKFYLTHNSATPYVWNSTDSRYSQIEVDSDGGEF